MKEKLTNYINGSLLKSYKRAQNNKWNEKDFDEDERNFWSGWATSCLATANDLKKHFEIELHEDWEY